MNGVSRTLLNSAPIQKMYEDTLSRNASSDMRTGAGLVGTAVSGAVKKIIKKRKVRRGRPRMSVGQPTAPVRTRRGRRQPLRSRIALRMKKKKNSGPRRKGRKPKGRKAIKTRAKPKVRRRKQTTAGRRRHNRSRAVRI